MSYEGHVAKRQKTEDSRYDDPHKPKPSPVVHVRNLSELATESDLVEAVQGFGSVKDVILIPRRKQGLVEFEDANAARRCVEYAEANPIFVASQAAFFNFSTSQKIQRPGEGDDVKPPNHILLFTVLNPQYPISAEVMHTICSPYGQVQRVVIFKKNGVQAMVEFDSVDSAKRAKQTLSGADIYSGCCTLKIEFAKPTRLNVVRNDTDSWDYTNPALNKDPHGQVSRGQPLLQEPRFGSGPGDMRGGPPGGFGGPAGGGFGGGYYDEFDNFGGGGRFNSGPPDRFGGPRGQFDQGMGGPQGGGAGCVMMVYGLNMEKMNCEKLFNLFCLYGNVIRIKFLKSKDGAAMVQLGDGSSVERAIVSLHKAYFFGNEIQLSMSKQAFLQDVNNPHELPDGTSSFKDFMGNRNNRFTNPGAAAKNRIQSPSKMLHFFNAPPSLSEDDLGEIFETCYGKRPIRVKVFPSKTERSSTGLLEFESKTEAMEALIMANHHPIPNAGNKSQFIFKLCFSASSPANM